MSSTRPSFLATVTACSTTIVHSGMVAMVTAA